MTFPRDNNMQESIISETYDLLNGSSEHISKDGYNYRLQKPSQNSELKEIRFRSFDPIMKKNLSTLSQRSAEITIEPKIMKATKGDKITKYNVKYNGGQDAIVTMNDSGEKHYQIINDMWYVENDVIDTQMNKHWFKNNAFIVSLQADEDLPVYYQHTKFLLYFDTQALTGLKRKYQGQVNFFVNCHEGWNIYDFTGHTPNESYGNMWFIFNHENKLTGPASWLEIHYSPTNADHHPHFGKLWDPVGDERLRVAQHVDHICGTIQFTTTIYTVDTLSYEISEYYTTKLLHDYDTSKLTLFTLANDTYLPIKSQTLKTNLIGTPQEIISNINEKIAGYCSNFKPSSTMRILDKNGETPKEWHLTNYEEGPNEDWSIEHYYNTFTGTNRMRSIVTPTRNFTKFYVEGDETSGYIFGTSHLLFNFRVFGTLDDPDVSPDIFYVMFLVDLHCDVDIFNVGLDRQYHNNLEHVAEAKYLDVKGLMNRKNQCISTNDDTLLNLTYANYLAHGLDIVLKSQHMANLTNTIFVNKYQADVYMKSAQQFSTQNHITVYLTDISNKYIEEDYLKKIYKSIMVEIDYVYA